MWLPLFLVFQHFFLSFFFSFFLLPFNPLKSALQSQFLFVREAIICKEIFLQTIFFFSSNHLVSNLPVRPIFNSFFYWFILFLSWILSCPLYLWYHQIAVGESAKETSQPSSPGNNNYTNSGISAPLLTGKLHRPSTFTTSSLFDIFHISFSPLRMLNFFLNFVIYLSLLPFSSFAQHCHRHGQ